MKLFYQGRPLMIVEPENTILVPDFKANTTILKKTKTVNNIPH